MQSLNENPAPPSIDSPSCARLIVVDDHDLLRASLRSMLECEHDLQIVGEAEDGQEAIELCRLHRPDLVLMDVGMPKVNGFEATRIIKAELPTTKVLMLSAHFDSFFASEVERAGADGYVTKLCTVQELVDAIRGVL
jgi:DNA-binding NarL/FixJ family response regulator